MLVSLLVDERRARVTVQAGARQFAYAKIFTDLGVHRIGKERKGSLPTAL